MRILLCHLLLDSAAEVDADFSEATTLSAKKKPMPESAYMSGTMSIARCNPIFSSRPATAAAGMTGVLAQPLFNIRHRACKHACRWRQRCTDHRSSC